MHYQFCTSTFCHSFLHWRCKTSEADLTTGATQDRSSRRPQGTATTQGDLASDLWFPTAYCFYIGLGRWSNLMIMFFNWVETTYSFFVDLACISNLDGPPAIRTSLQCKQPLQKGKLQALMVICKRSGAPRDCTPPRYVDCGHILHCDVNQWKLKRRYCVWNP